MIDQNSSTYETVLHKKVEGRLVLSIDDLTFHPAEASSPSILLPWSTVVKHQVSPATYPKSLLKLMLSDGKGSISDTYQLASREELERIRKDVTIRMQCYRNLHPSPHPSLSSKKRSHNSSSETNGFHIDPANTNTGKTTATSFGELDATALAVTRSSLLAANPSLRAQHQYLVEETQTVQEEDFWKTHNDLLEEEYARICGMTKAGTSSLLQSHLQLLTGRVTLGVEEMRQIFILYPAVHKAYEEKVPLELSDEQFWRKYLESEFFHRDRGRIGAASRREEKERNKNKKKKNGLSAEDQEARAAAVGTDDLFSRYDQKIRDGNKKLEEESRKKWGTKLAVGQFDLASTFETERGNVLEGPRDNHPLESDDGKGAKVIQKYNRHWAMVMHPEDAVAGSDLMTVARRSVTEVMPDDQDAKAGGGMDADMKRLVGFAMSSTEDANHARGIGLAGSDEYEEMNLTNIEAYYSGRPSTTKADADDNETRKRNGYFANALASKVNALAAATKDAKDKSGSQLEEAFPPPQLGKELLTALTKKMAADSQTDADALEVVNSLPEDFKKRLHSYFRRSSELLRHFFGLRKLADSQGNNAFNQKLQKIVTGMETVYREMDGMRKELESTGEKGEIMRKMCLQIMDQLDWAFKLNREGTGVGGGGGFVTIEDF